MNASEALSLLAIGSALLVGAISPGPSFVMVARTAIAHSRQNGLAAALGMGVGGFILSVAALAGLHAVLATIPTLYLALKMIGGVYLLYLGIRIWRSARETLAVEAENQNAPCSPPRHAFLLGLLTQLSNPKTSIVYASIFAALLPGDASTTLILVIPPLIFTIEIAWYSLVALTLSAASPRAAYLRHKAHFDHLAGGIITLLGLKLLIDPRQV